MGETGGMERRREGGSAEHIIRCGSAVGVAVRREIDCARGTVMRILKKIERFE